MSNSGRSRLFERVAATSALPTGNLRARLIPDLSWKRARKTLGPPASQTAARLSHILGISARVWGNKKDATEWLKTLIHAGDRKLPPRALTRIEIPDDVVLESAGWLEMPASQAFGEAWVREARTAVLRAPSVAVNRMESNIVMNPAHPDFARIMHAPSQPHVFNPRFFALGYAGFVFSRAFPLMPR